jgi:hypothetical protein
LARCDGLPIEWSQITHGNPKAKGFDSKKLKPWRTAAECINWSIPCPSIFDRKKPLAESTLKRIAKDITRYVIEAQEPFIVSLAHGEESPSGVKRWGSGVRDTKVPLQTVLASGNGAAIVMPIISSYYGNKSESSDTRGSIIDEPLKTQTTGNRRALVSAFLAKHYTGVLGQPLDKPSGTVTTVDHHAVFTAHMAKFNTGSAVTTYGNFDLHITGLSNCYKKELLDGVTDDISKKFVGRVVLGYSPHDWESQRNQSLFLQVEVTTELLEEIARLVQSKSIKKMGFSTQIMDDYLYTTEPYAYHWEKIELNLRPRKENNDANRAEPVSGRLRAMDMVFGNKFVAQGDDESEQAQPTTVKSPQKSETVEALEKIRSSILSMGWLLLGALVILGILSSR